jgi:hypothetical protein
VETESGQVSIYDLRNWQLRQQHIFSDPVSFQSFSRDGNRLFVMTASRTAYILDQLSQLFTRPKGCFAIDETGLAELSRQQKTQATR